MSLKIDTSFPGGNIFIEDIDGFEVTLTKDLRNTDGDWFYWAFRCTFDAIGTYHFKFTNGWACGARGPAVSYDNCMNWEWLGDACVSGEKRCEFVYEYDGTRGNPVIFCFGMQYQQVHLDAFLAKHQGDDRISVETLAYTRKNRAVEIIHIEDKTVGGEKKRIFLTSRHHCCEMMATYAMEGILDAILKDDDLGRELREKFIFDAVPFVDKDGVVDGDQGKNRRPHDHARDYGAVHNLYQEVVAIQNFLLATKPYIVNDLHCPWICMDSNESIYFPGPADKDAEARMLRMSAILEEEAPACAPHYSRDNILYGVGWNTGANYTKGMPLSAWVNKQEFARFAGTLEIAYANAREITLTPDSVRELGRALARTYLRFAAEMG
ncbi:MAG: hypothetical protein J6Q65_00620 [Lentisphaeria bacterium]|nr:hypothetical protein [Lentisphaeria bacterium]